MGLVNLCSDPPLNEPGPRTGGCPVKELERCLLNTRFQHEIYPPEVTLDNGILNNFTIDHKLPQNVRCYSIDLPHRIVTSFSSYSCRDLGSKRRDDLLLNIAQTHLIYMDSVTKHEFLQVRQLVVLSHP